MNTATPGLDRSLGRTLGRRWCGALDAIWRLYGPPDLGPVDFATLRREGVANDALACPDGFCPGAEADFAPPVFPVPAGRLRALLAEAALAMPGTVKVASDGGQDRYVVRTRVLRFPDTVVAQVIALDERRSSLALYGRSRVGRTDFGVNRRRLRGWVDALAERVDREKGATA